MKLTVVVTITVAAVRFDPGAPGGKGGEKRGGKKDEERWYEREWRYVVQSVARGARFGGESHSEDVVDR